MHALSASLGYFGSPWLYIIKSGWKTGMLLNAGVLLSSSANQGLIAWILQGTISNSTEDLRFARPCCPFCCTLIQQALLLIPLDLKRLMLTLVSFEAEENTSLHMSKSNIQNSSRKCKSIAFRLPRRKEYNTQNMLTFKSKKKAYI